MSVETAASNTLLDPAPVRDSTVAAGRSETLRRLIRNRLVVLGGGITALFVLTGATGLVFIALPGLNYLFLGQNLMQSLAPPPAPGLLGTDALGRDLLARTVVGVGVSLGIGVVVTMVSLLIGGTLGLIAGYIGGTADALISGVVDITWSFPIILLAIVLSGVFQPGLTIVVLSVSLINWAGFARIVRGETLSLREREFVKAARALNLPTSRILLRHFVPNMVAPALVMASYYMAITIIAEAGLSFIGVGVQPPTPSLGQMIASGQDYWTIDVWVVAVPGVALVLLVMGLNALGDGLRDVLDPRLRERR